MRMLSRSRSSPQRRNLAAMASTISSRTRSASVKARPQLGKAGHAKAQRSTGSHSSADRTPYARNISVIRWRSAGSISLRMMSWLGIRIGSQRNCRTMSRNAVRNRTPSASTMRPLAIGKPR